MFMNQILFVKKTKLIIAFKIQFVISIIIAIVLSIYILYDYNSNQSLENISEVINKNIGLASIYELQNYQRTQNNNYLGKIIIKKIDLEYVVLNQFSEEHLKILPCKFHGVSLGEIGNICIAAHNYNDQRFFGRLNELKIKDVIILQDFNQKNYEYIVYDIFETDENDQSILKASNKYELTLLTCNNSNKKRIIVKAYMKLY